MTVIALLFAATIVGSIPAAVEKTLETHGQIPAESDEYSTLRRRVYKTELENEATRVLADVTAAKVVTGGCDITTTGWSIKNGGVEGNKLLGGSETNALIILGTKAVALGVQFLVQRRQATAYVACMLKQYDGENVSCNQLRNMKRTAILMAAVHGGLCANNLVVAKRAGEQ